MPHATARRLTIPPTGIRRFAPRWAGSALALVACGAVLLAFGGAYWDGYQLRRDAAGLAREREELRLQNAQLREEIRLLNTPEYLERLAREQLGLVRRGEIAIILVRPTPAPAPEAVSTPRPDDRDPAPWWTRFLDR